MHLVQLLLPLANNTGEQFPEQVLREIQAELTERFGGLTAYTRAPAKGVWTSGGEQQKDDIVVVEVMTETLDEAWWQELRTRLEKLLQQEHLLIRSQEMRIL